MIWAIIAFTAALYFLAVSWVGQRIKIKRLEKELNNIYEMPELKNMLIAATNNLMNKWHTQMNDFHEDACREPKDLDKMLEH